VAGNEFVRFGTPQAVYQQDQEVEVTVRLSDELTGLRPGMPAAARIIRAGGAGQKDEAVALVPLEAREAQPRVLQGRIRNLPAGPYAIELAIPDLADKLRAAPGPDGRPAGMRANFTVTPADTGETAELATNWPLLEELAAKSGGKVYTADNAAELVNLLTRQTIQRVEHPERRLWEWWVTLAVVLALLTAEWVGRKWAGLP
jgi:hypothetical protein